MRCRSLYLAAEVERFGIERARQLACHVIDNVGHRVLGEAFETVRRGDAKAIVCGGTDEPIVPLMLAGFQALRGMAKDPDPTKACKP